MRGVFVTGTDTEVGKSVVAASICAALAARGEQVAAFKPVVIAARTCLGTINHTVLTVEAARAGGLTVAAVVMTPWPDEPTAMELSNRDTIARLGDVSVTTLPRTTPGRLAEAGARLPVADWL